MDDIRKRLRGMDRGKLDASKPDFDSIPVIDIAPLFGADEAEIDRIADEIGDACRLSGFLYVTNHGIPEAVIAAAYREAGAFFALPLEEKLECDIQKQKRHRGYVPMGALNADPGNEGAVDLQEGYEVSLELPADDPDYLAGNIMAGPNVWPARPPGFRDAVYAYHAAALELGHMLFRGFARALDMPADWFEDKIDKPMAQLRLIHYPPGDDPANPERPGIGPHTDYECFTILSQNSPGLQVHNAAGEWVEAPPIAGALVINIGDMMTVWSNGDFVSTVHRVINTTGADRLSMAFFFGTNYDTVVAPLESCTGPGNPPRHKPVHAGDWQVRNIAAAYTYLDEE